MANSVTDARVRKHWTQTELAKRAGVSLDTITRAEQGAGLLPLTQQKIADALGIERTDLFAEAVA